MDCCCQIEIQGLKIESCWVLITFFSWIWTSDGWRYWAKLTLTSAMKIGLCIGIPWDGWKELTAASQKHHPSFQPRKWKKPQLLCSGMFQPVSWGPIHLSMFLIYKDRACWSLTCTICVSHVIFFGCAIFLITKHYKFKISLYGSLPFYVFILFKSFWHVGQ